MFICSFLYAVTAIFFAAQTQIEKAQTELSALFLFYKIKNMQFTLTVRNRLFVYIWTTYLIEKRAFSTLGILETSSTNPQLLAKVSNSDATISP